MARTFEDKPAVRERVPLWIGLFGASGSGKTYSAMRLATGIQRVFPGEIFGIDTEACRMLHYTPAFKFRHIEFNEPFRPADYLAAVEHCVDKRASVVVIDSMSHSWEGEGGVLQMADATGRSDAGKWQKPKEEHRKMVQGLLQMRANIIFCFRAKPKIKMVKGKEPIELGYQPIASDDLPFEMTLNCMLPPASFGVPDWNPEFKGERGMLKLPEQFRQMFASEPPPQLTEDLGEQLARWAAGDTVVSKADEFVAELDKCLTVAEFEVLKSDAKRAWKQFTKEQADIVSAAVARCKTRLEEGAKA